MNPVKISTAFYTGMTWLCLTIPQQLHASAVYVDNDTRIKIIDSIAELTEVTTSDADEGEASYNTKNCEALLEQAENEESQDGGAASQGGDVKKLDLDKCRTMKK